MYNKKIFFRLIFYLVPVVLVSVGLNLTKFFETEIVTSSEEEEVKYEIFESKNINITLSSQVECKVKTGPTFIIFMILGSFTTMAPPRRQTSSCWARRPD